MTWQAGRLIIGTRREDTGRYTGVLRRDGEIVAECGHTHPNRDTSTKTSGMSARDCIASAIRAARLPTWHAEELARLRRVAAGNLGGGGGFTVGRSTVERIKAKAVEELGRYEALHAKLVELIGDEAIYGAGTLGGGEGRPVFPAVPR